MNLVDSCGWLGYFADGIILTVARQHDTMLWTQDAHFDGLAGVKYVRKN